MRHFFAALATSTLVSAHGWVDNATIGGQFYQASPKNTKPYTPFRQFYQPYQDPYMGDGTPQRISRKTTSNGPVQDVTSIDLQCGGISSEGVAGSTVTLRWTMWPDSHIGPILTYMARCPDDGCDKWLPGEEPVFFKIHHDGRHTTDKTYPDDTSGPSKNHKQTPLMTPYNAGYHYTIPACLAPGYYYLLCHEIIALHSAWAEGEAHELLVSFPGAYKADDPGIFVDIWNPGNYTIPGPAIWKCPEAQQNE
ncbi:hypothetical protein VTG60DRAFT_2807 [Thermothelomyces hinnuleus]